MTAANEDLKNRQIGGYRCLMRIAEGGTSMVWKAQTLDAKHQVAIKLLKPEAIRDRSVRRAFARELKLCHALHHPGLLRYREGGSFEGTPYIVLEYFESLSLKQRLTPELRRQTLKRADKILIHAARALDYIHEHGIVHRDVKPENLLVGDEGDTKLIDFSAALHGIAKWLPFARQAVGTPSYVAPEQLLRKAAKPAADIYAFGAVIYEMLAGRPPFVGETQGEMLQRKLTADPPLLSRLNREVTPGLDKLVSAMLARSPGDRPCDCKAFLRQLQKTGVFL